MDDLAITSVDIVVTNDQDKKTIEAYKTAMDQFVVHRHCQWSYVDNDIKFLPGWSITHTETGYSVLRSEQKMPTKEAAFALVEEMLSQGMPPDPRDDIDNAREIRDNAVTTILDEVKAAKEDAPPKKEIRYVIERADRGFAVIDSQTGDEQERFAHRGAAAQAARDLNKTKSI